MLLPASALDIVHTSPMILQGMEPVKPNQGPNASLLSKRSLIPTLAFTSPSGLMVVCLQMKLDCCNVKDT